MADRITDCGGCPLRQFWGTDIPVFENGRRIAFTKHKEVGFRDSQIKDALKRCRPAIATMLKRIKPKIIVCLGNPAMQTIMGKSGITKHHGKLEWSKEFNCWTFPLYHPAFCLRDAGNFPTWRVDMAQMASLVKSGYRPPELFESGKVEVVDDIQFILDQRNINLGIDTEAQGVDWVNKQNSVLISYQISIENGKGYVVHLLKEVGPSEPCDTIIQWPRKNGRITEIVPVRVKKEQNYRNKLLQLREILRREDIKKYMMTGHDLHRFEQIGIPKEQVKSYVMDIQTAFHCLDPDSNKMASMRDIQAALMPGQADHKTLFSAQHDKGDMLKVKNDDLESFNQYSGTDASTTRSCGLILKQRLLEDRKLANYYVKFVQPVTTTVLHEIEANGIAFATDLLPRAQQEVVTLVQDMERKAIARIPHKILDYHEVEMGKKLALTRKQLICDALFTSAGFDLQPLEYTPTGQPATDRKTLVRLRDELRDGHRAYEFLSDYIGWGPYQKLMTTYLGAKEGKGFSHHVRIDNRLHPSVSSTRTATGRTGMVDPPLQTIPKRNRVIAQIIRRLLVAPPGKVLLALDISNSEMRWFAMIGGISQFLDVFRKGGDIHINTASELLRLKGTPWDTLPQLEQEKYRQNAKPVNFGFLYGMFPPKFKVYARDEYGVAFTVAESEEIRRAYLEDIYSDIPGYHEWQVQFARHNGYVRSPFGRKRLTPNINSYDFMAKIEDEHVALNTPTQSVSSDSPLLAGLMCREKKIIDNKDRKIVLFIHDELIFEIPEQGYEQVAEDIIDQVENELPKRVKKDFGYEMAIKLVADGKVGTNLAEMQKLKR